MEFKEITELKNIKWEYEFYKEEIYRYVCLEIEPHPSYIIRALYYSNGYLLTLADLGNEEDFRDKPKLLTALKMGPFDGHRDSIEQCISDTIWKIGNAVKRALET